MPNETDPDDNAPPSTNLPRRLYLPSEGAEALAAAIERRRQELSQVHVSVNSLGNLMIEAYDFDRREPDLGLCCKAASDILLRVIAALEGMDAAAVEAAAREKGRLGAMLEDQRQQLFLAHAVVRATAVLCRLHHEKHGEADLSHVLAAADKAIDELLADLEPLSLGLLDV